MLVSGVLSESVIQTSTLFPYRSLQSTEKSSLCHTIAIIVLSPLSLIQAFHIDICIRDLPMFINRFFFSFVVLRGKTATRASFYLQLQISIFN